mgnify:CR=1 FL=1
MTMTSVNNGEPYYLKADISKAGESAVSINNYIKMRVFDNGKVLPVKWFDQNVVMNVNGMIPFIEGSVGQFSTDDNDNIVMAPDAVHRDWQGTAANTRDGGWADYVLTDQMFTEEGAFSGFIGLMDGNGRRLTSINIWFRVLGDNLIFGLTQKYYSDKIEKFIRQMQAKANDTFRDIKDKYDQEVAAHSKALTDDTAALRNLAATAGSIKSELEAKNYVEYADFTKSNDAMRNAIDDRLKHISLNPETFSTLDDLKQKYPTGKEGLFRVGDTGYIFENGQWKSSGVLSSTVVSDADFNQRVGSFMFFESPNNRVEITEKHDTETDRYTGHIDIPTGVLVYLADNGKFKHVNVFKLDYSYSQQEVNDNGVLTLYFDNNSKLYLAYTPQRRNDVRMFSIYDGRVYGGINTDLIYFNGIGKGGWGNRNRIAKAMSYTGDDKIYAVFSNNNYTITIPQSVNFIDKYGYNWSYRNGSQQIEYQGNETTVVSLFLKYDCSGFYLDTKAEFSDDYLIASFYQAHAYGPSNDDIIVNNIDNGGFGSNSVNGYSMLLPMYEDDNHISVEFDQSNWKYNISYPDINVIETNSGKHYVGKAGTATGQGDSNTTLNVYFDVETQNLYIDTLGHRSTDVMIATLYSAYAYGQDVRAFVVNGIDNGGFGQVYKPYTLTDWRIDAYAGQEVNIVWLGDSTFEGFKVKNSENIAANYINKLLINNFPKVRSYNCSKGGWTTRQLADNFEQLTKDVPNMKLVLIGGGINDRENIADSRKALDEIVKKVQRKQIVPIICTTQASALLYANQSEGGDWTLEQDWYAKINEMRRIYAKEHNVMLIDLEKYDTKFIEYGPNKLSEMFDDQMHGHDPIHKFEAQLVMSYLAKDHVDIIEEDTPVTVTTMKARSDSTYNLTSQELDDSALNSKGFKARMSRQNVSQDLTILDYQFFIPAGYKKYYLNGYNLGDPVSVGVNGEKSTLSTTEQIKELEPGYYHILVKPTTDKFDFVGLRIEGGTVNEAQAN